MANENGSPQDPGELPERVITVNQVVAWNLAWYRRAAGLTQAQLGTLIGWKKPAVSDAERSVSGQWTRKFDAQDQITIASALDIPVGALFLPPLDDGVSVRYIAEIPDGRGGALRLDMNDLTAFMLPDFGSDSPAMLAYKNRLRNEVGRRFPDHKAEADRWFEIAGPDEIRADLVARYRSRRDQYLALAAEEDDMANFYEGKDGGS